MNRKVRTMLEEMYSSISQRQQDPRKSWDCLLEFIAASHCDWLAAELLPRMEWLTSDSDLAESLMNRYDSKLIKSDYHDHLGEMYAEKIVSRGEARAKGLYLSQEGMADLLNEISLGRSDKSLTILDPAAGSGRLLMAAHTLAPNARLFGVDSDLHLVRIALSNFAIHDIPGYLLHANPLEHAIDISTADGHDNWWYANQWDSSVERLKTLPGDRNVRRPLRPR